MNKEQVLTISHIENHLTSSHKELNISIDSDNIIKNYNGRLLKGNNYAKFTY